MRQLPLSPAEHDALARAIVPHSVDAALGMLAAVVSVPAMLPSQVWLGELLGGGKVENIEQAQRAAELVMRLNNFVAASLMERKPRAFFPDVDDDEACREFVTGYLRTCAQAEVDPKAKGKIGEGLQMLFMYSQLSEVEMRRAGIKDIDGYRTTIRSGLPEIIGVMHATWLEERKGPTVAARAAPRAPSRNQPCPCGSGKKYKRCCGAAAN